MECPKLEYRPIDNEWGQIWAGADERCKNPRCIVYKIFWKYGRSIVTAINSHDKLVKALEDLYDLYKKKCTGQHVKFQRITKMHKQVKQALKEAEK